MARSCILIGATSGIGLALAREMAGAGWRVGITGRRSERLERLRQEAPDRLVVQAMDVTRLDEALTGFGALWEALGGGVDCVVINAGVGTRNPKLDLETDLQMIDTNARSFAALAAEAYKRFAAQGRGQIVGITSISAERAGPGIAYNASKAFASRYLEGLRMKAIAVGLPIAVTDVRPGFVDTDMISKEKAFWLAPAGKAARQILRAIERRKRIVHVTKRWVLISWLFKFLPERVFVKLIYR